MFKSNFVDKHMLMSIQSTERLNNPYTWLEGIKLRTNDPCTEIAEIVKYGSKEAYEASLPEYTDEFMLDIDGRVAMLEMGITESEVLNMEHGRSYGLCKKIVAVGKMSKEKMLEKFDVLVLSGGLTDDDYKELVAQINNLSE